MKRLLLCALVVLMLGGLMRAHAQERPIAEAIVMVSDGCTGFVIRPGLVATASHCVGQPGGPASIIALIDGRRHASTGVVVWDSSFQDFPGNTGVVDEQLDFALVAVPGLPTRVVAFDVRTPAPRTSILSISMAGGIYHWTAELTFVGAFWHNKIGDIFVYRGDTYPGASGSPTLLNGRVVGIVTHGIIEASPFPIIMGAPSTRMLVAVEDFDKYGAMRFCQVQLPEGKTRRDLCRGDVRTSSSN